MNTNLIKGRRKIFLLLLFALSMLIPWTNFNPNVIAQEPLGFSPQITIILELKVDGVIKTGTDATYELTLTDTVRSTTKTATFASGFFNIDWGSPVPMGSSDVVAATYFPINLQMTIKRSGTPLKIVAPTTAQVIIADKDTAVVWYGTGQTIGPVEVETPKPALTMTYDSTAVVSGGTIPYGNVTIGGVKVITVTFQNTGDVGTTLNITSIAMTGAASAKFTPSSTADLNIPKGATTGNTIGITFMPDVDPASYTAALTFKSNTGASGATEDKTLNLTAAGVLEATASFTATGDISGNVIAFGNVNVGSSSAEKTVTITSTGDYGLYIGQLKGSGTDKDQFSITSDTCSNKQNMAKNDTCAIKGKFSPTTSGPKAATAPLLTNRGKTGAGKDTPNVQDDINLTGKGIQTGFIVSPGSLDYGTITLPDSPLPVDKTVTIENTGTEDLNNFILSTTAGSQFGVSPTTIATIAVGASANVTVTYTPIKAAIAHTDTLNVTSGSITRTVSLTGTTKTRPNTPTNTLPADGATDVALAPTFTSSAFSDDDNPVGGTPVSTHAGSQWIIKGASDIIVYQTQTLDASGNYTAGYDANNRTSFTLPKGILQYSTQYKWQVRYKDNRVITSVPSTLTTFTTLAKPDGYDDYGVPTVAVPKDTSGNTIAKIDATNMNNSEIKKVIPQIGIASPIITAGELKDASGNTVAKVTGFTPIKSQGGVGSTLLFAAGSTTAADTITSIEPISVTGKTVDASGNLTVTAIPNLSVPSSISLPYGLFNINITVAGASTKVVIVPPSPFSSGTKWYKVDSTGVPQVYPNFVVDASGNGILTLTDNGPGDADPRVGFIRDPGGPGAAVSSALAGDYKSGGMCFIATAAFGSYLDPYVKILRDFRDTFLVTNRIGQVFVNWYYRTSPPIADYIAKSDFAKASVRIMLLPLVGFSALMLKIGMFWSMIFVLIMIGTTFMVVRRLYISIQR